MSWYQGFRIEPLGRVPRWVWSCLRFSLPPLHPFPTCMHALSRKREREKLLSWVNEWVYLNVHIIKLTFCGIQFYRFQTCIESCIHHHSHEKRTVNPPKFPHVPLCSQLLPSPVVFCIPFSFHYKRSEHAEHELNYTFLSHNFSVCKWVCLCGFVVRTVIT